MNLGISLACALPQKTQPPVHSPSALRGCYTQNDRWQLSNRSLSLSGDGNPRESCTNKKWTSKSRAHANNDSHLFLGHKQPSTPESTHEVLATRCAELRAQLLASKVFTRSLNQPSFQSVEILADKMRARLKLF